MSETPVPKGSSFLRKKVAGVPVVYLAGGFVLILAVIAWQLKPSAKTSDVASADAPQEMSTDTILREGQTYPALPLGTVNSSTPPAPDTNTDNASIQDNDEWLRRAVAFLGGKGISPGAAQLAMSLYLQGAELTYEQGQWRDAAIRELGVPPYASNIGGTREDIGRVQGPIPRDHIVKNGNENTAAKLAGLYYGSPALASAISNVNNGAANYTVGQTVKIPAKPTAPPLSSKPVVSKPTPTKPGPIVKPAPPRAPAIRYYTVKSGDSLSKIAQVYYRNAAQWPKIYNANRNIVKDPNLIYPGQRLVIPQ